MKVTLLKPLTLRGEEHAIGDRVEVDADTAAWLAERGVIAPLPAAPTTGKAAGSKES